MPNLVVAILTNMQACHDVIHTWEEAGVTGATILDSVGIRQFMERQAHQDDLPLIPSLRALIEQEEYDHRTLFSVVPDEIDLDDLFRRTEIVVGQFDGGRTGIMFVVPVLKVHGLVPRNQTK